MGPMRSFGGGGGLALDFMAAKLAVGLVAGSVLFALTREQLGGLLLLLPSQVLGRLFLWQPLTYAFIEASPIGVIFGALILYMIGGALEASWGSRRLLRVALGCTVVAGLLTSGVGLFFALPASAGGTVMTTVVWVAYGLAIGRGQTNFWGIPITGNVFAGIGAGFVLLSSLFYGFSRHLPELFALGLTYVYVRGASPRHLWLRFQHWRLQRQLRGRSRHLRVISSERPDSDRYLN